MIIRVGDYWTEYDKADLFLFTSNSVVKRDGSLVMGAGSALQVKKRFPGIEYELGSAVTHMSMYGLMLTRTKLGMFQTKIDYRDNSSLDCISKSAADLRHYVKGTDLKVHCPFPGIGHGNLNPLEVAPLLTCLPDNVHFWIKLQ